MIDFSTEPCHTCGWRHQVDAFTSKQRVRIVSQHRSRGHRLSSGQCPEIDWVGCTGTVINWSCRRAVWVRVEFADGERETFDPCELEHAP